jgi:hypothetical protein
MRRHITTSTPSFLNPRLDFFVQNNNTYLPADRDVKMTILNSGNVGIGTDSPRGFVGIEKPAINVSSGVFNNPHLALQAEGDPTNYDGFVGITYATSSSDNFGWSSGAKREDTGVGHFIWQYHANNAVGTEFMRIAREGHVTIPLQPAFLVRTGVGGSATNVPINATTIVDFDTEIFDRGADFSTNTFTAPVTGVYQINFSGVLSAMDTASTYVEVQIQCSNRSFNWTIDPDVFDQDAVYFPVNISCLADMDASDVAKIAIILPNGGTAQIDLTNNTYFSGYLVAISQSETT